MAMLTDALTLLQGIEVVCVMRSESLKQPDGYHLPVTVFTLILAKWVKGSAQARNLPSLLFVDPRSIADSKIVPF
jgi:hypothetical protein